MKKNTLKIGLWAVIILLGLWACQKDLETPQPINEDKEIAITDSIHKIPTEKLPDFFKVAIEDSIFIKPYITARNGMQSNASDSYFERQAVKALSEDGVTTYSLPIKKGVSIESIVKNPKVAKALLNYKNSCEKEQLSNGADSTYPTYEVISMNNYNNITSEPTYTNFVNYGPSIHVTHINLNTGGMSETWTPNPVNSNFHGGNFWNGVGTSFGNIFGNIWSGIKSIGRGIGSLFRSKKCNCSGRRFPESWSGTLSSCCDAEGDISSVSASYSILLPSEFLEFPKKKLAEDLDCDCLFDNNKTMSDLQDQAYFDCSCKSDNINGMAQYLQLTAKEKGYLERDKALKREICKFIWDNNYSEEAIAFAKEAVKAKMASGEVDFPNKVILDPSFVNNARLKCVYDRFKNGKTTISNYLKTFLEDNPIGYLKISTDDNFQINHKKYKDATAITVPPNNYIIEIVFNTDNNSSYPISKTPTIFLGISLIHEMVHVEIFRKLLECSELPYVNIENKGSKEWKNFITNMMNKYNVLYKYYEFYKLRTSTPDNYQHQLMAKKYVKMMSESLAEFDRHQHSQMFYYNLSWIGLESTGAYTSKKHDEQIAIYNTIQAALKNESYECN